MEKKAGAWGLVADPAEIADLIENYERKKGGWHNDFHLEMLFGLINDPNGLAFVDGIYHICMQWNPLGCAHKNKCWAHTETADFVHYTSPRLIMQPTDAHDKDGCYSGCGFADEAGNYRLLYSCNRKEGEERIAAQRICTVKKDGMCQKDAIVVENHPEGYTGHFRDPYVFQRAGRWYFVIGAQRKDKTGCALLYAAEDRDLESAWRFCGEIATRYLDFGYMWECPGFLQFETGDALLFCPQGLEPEEGRYQNRFQSGYLVGNLDLEKRSFVEFQGTEFRELDRGFDFYAPQVLDDGKRKILFGWCGMPDEEDLYPTCAEGWLHSLTMPREILFRDGRLYSQPVNEMESLRIKESVCEVKNNDFHTFNARIPCVAEILLELRFGEAEEAAAIFFFGEERFELRYFVREERVRLDRSFMELGGQGVRNFHLPAEDGALKLRIFLDRSLMEIFFQDGVEAATVALFPQEADGRHIRVEGKGKLEAAAMKYWELRPFVTERRS